MRKRKSLLCGACLIFLGTHSAFAQPFDEAKGYMSYALSQPSLLKKTIVPSERDLSVDDAVIALAKASNVNFIADDTQIPADLFVAPFPTTPVAHDHKWKPTFLAVTEDLCEATQLAGLFYDDTTFLLWKRPDVVDTANTLLEAGKLLLTRPLPEQESLYQALDNFRKNSAGWKDTAPETVPGHPTTIQLRAGDVPLEIREPLLALLRYGILRPDWKREAMLSDSFWKTARVLVDYSMVNLATQKPIVRVYVAGQDGQGHLLPFFQVDRQLTLLDGVLERVGYPLPPTANLTPVLETPPPLVQGLSVADLEKQEALKTLISLEVKRQPLNAVLAEISKQSHVTLTRTKGSAPLPITLHIQGMALSELMGALSRLSGDIWQKNATGYELQPQPLEKWQRLLLHSGEGDFEGYGIESQFTPEQLQPLRDLEQAVVDEVGQKMTPQGVPFSTLSADLQEQIKQVVRPAVAENLVRSYNKAFVYSEPEGIVSLTRGPTFSNPIEATDLRYEAAFPKWFVRLTMADARMADGRREISAATLSRPPILRTEEAIAQLEKERDQAQNAP